MKQRLKYLFLGCLLFSSLLVLFCILDRWVVSNETIPFYENSIIENKIMGLENKINRINKDKFDEIQTKRFKSIKNYKEYIESINYNKPMKKDVFINAYYNQINNFNDYLNFVLEKTTNQTKYEMFKNMINTAEMSLESLVTNYLFEYEITMSDTFTKDVMKIDNVKAYYSLLIVNLDIIDYLLDDLLLEVKL